MPTSGGGGGNAFDKLPKKNRRRGARALEHPGVGIDRTLDKRHVCKLCLQDHRIKIRAVGVAQGVVANPGTNAEGLAAPGAGVGDGALTSS